MTPDPRSLCAQMGDDAPNSIMEDFSVVEIHMLVSTAQFPDFGQVVSQVPGKVGMMPWKNSSSSKLTGVAEGTRRQNLWGKENYRNISRCQIVIF